MFRSALRPVLLSSRVSLASPRFALPSMQLRAFQLSSALARQVPDSFRLNRPITFDELKPITDQPNDDILLIDVREQDEVAAGAIPSAVNLPLSSFPDSLLMDEGQFVQKFGFRKPGKDACIIVNCRSGKRSETALQEMKAKGWKNVRNYEGSWLDWVERSKGSSDQDD
ncbi:Rhodanese-like protein [Atractiella rhizophila]|nr:Rhodanese-like protein [Atractiella rhizophila]